MTKTNDIQMVEDAKLDAVAGGLLLPAVQKVREAAVRTQSTGLTKAGTGTLTLAGSN